MKKISRRSFLAAAGLSVAALALTACGGSSASTASSVASSAASSEAASTSAAAGELTTVEAGKLTMATNATFPPYEMTTDAGEFEGIDIETAQAIADKLGLELQIDDMDFDAALLSVQQGKADIVMAGVTVTDERKAVMDFSDSYATGIQSIIVPEGSDIASPDDLAGKKIGTQRGTTGYIYCTDDFGEDAVAARVDVPIIASGGAGKKEDFLELFHHKGIDAGLAAGIFHQKLLTIRDLKEYLAENGVEMRL